jgi:hypothetical protein
MPVVSLAYPYKALIEQWTFGYSEDVIEHRKATPAGLVDFRGLRGNVYSWLTNRNATFRLSGESVCHHSDTLVAPMGVIYNDDTLSIIMRRRYERNLK